MARHFCGSLIFRIGDIFLLCAGTNFWDCQRLVFRARYEFFCNFQKVAFPAFVVPLLCKLKGAVRRGKAR